MPAWFSLLFVLPTLFLIYKNHWTASISLVTLVMLMIVNSEWNRLPQTTGQVTTVPMQIIVSIILINASFERKWFDIKSKTTLAVIGGTFTLSVLLYYLIFSYLILLNGYIIALVTLLLFSGLPILCGWAHSYFRR